MGPYLQEVVAVGVAKVPHADLAAHVPAAEGGGWELQTADFQQHVGHGRQGVPAESQLLKPQQPGVNMRGGAAGEQEQGAGPDGRGNPSGEPHASGRREFAPRRFGLPPIGCPRPPRRALQHVGCQPAPNGAEERANTDLRELDKGAREVRPSAAWRSSKEAADGASPSSGSLGCPPFSRKWFRFFVREASTALGKGLFKQEQIFRREAKRLPRKNGKGPWPRGKGTFGDPRPPRDHRAPPLPIWGPAQLTWGGRWAPPAPAREVGRKARGPRLALAGATGGRRNGHRGDASRTACRAEGGCRENSKWGRAPQQNRIE